MASFKLPSNSFKAEKQTKQPQAKPSAEPPAELPRRNKRCNVLLEVGEDSFMAHKEVLVARMKYFRYMFTSTSQQKEKLVVKLDPKIVDPAVFDDILDYLYTLKITFTSANLESLVKAADFFGLMELKAQAEIFMKNNVNTENVALYLHIATKYNLKDREKECMQLIMLNLPLHSRARFSTKNLSLFQLSSLLQTLHDLSRFEDMFNLSVEWILHDRQHRAGKILELLQKIPMGRLPFDFFRQVVSKNNLVMNDNRCLKLMFNSVIENPPKFQLEELYVFGGKDGSGLSSMSKYDSSTLEWFELSPMPLKVSHFASVVVNKRIYICGGHDGQSSLNTLFMFDTNTHQWTVLRTMGLRREGCAMAYLGGYLYVAGGWAHEADFNEVERYSIENDVWEDVPSMIYKRNGLELVRMDHCLYAMGGYSGDKYLKSVERYDPRTGKWTPCANMNHFYGWFGSAVFNNRIFVAGSGTCEAYNLQDNKWEVMPAPAECGGGRRLVVLYGKLYSTGGRIGQVKDWKGNKVMECYDPERRSWSAIKDMNIARCHHGVAVITRK